jgi:hypothetical protein
VRIALYKDIHADWETVSIENRLDSSTAYVRVSEFVDVDFPKLSDAETVQKQLAALDTVRAEVSRKFAAALKEIDQRKASLQALTYDGVAA